MKKQLLSLLAAATLTSAAFAQNKLDTLSLDSDVRTMLKNKGASMAKNAIRPNEDNARYQNFFSDKDASVLKGKNSFIIAARDDHQDKYLFAIGEDKNLDGTVSLDEITATSVERTRESDNIVGQTASPVDGTLTDVYVQKYDVTHPDGSAYFLEINTADETLISKKVTPTPK